MSNIKLSGGKKLKEARRLIDPLKSYDLSEGVKTLKEISFAKFDETLEVVMNLGVDPRHSDQMVRGMVILPAGSGKNVRVAVICKDDKIEDVKAAGADLYGSEEIIEAISSGRIDFDVCITTPDMMGIVGRVARILGPRGLMPNPKLGTVTTDIKTAVRNAKSGQVEFKVEKAGIIHAGIGKLSFSSEDLESNIKALVNAIVKAKPSGAKGTFVKSVYLSTTMGPSLKVDFSGSLEAKQ